MESKGFDCAEFQDQQALRLYELLKDLTMQEQLDFWRQKTRELIRLQEEVKRKMQVPAEE